MKRLLRRLYHSALTLAVLALALPRHAGRARRARRAPLPAGTPGGNPGRNLARAPGRDLAGEPEEGPGRILVIRFGLLGDGTALLSPTLQRLRRAFPQAEVHVLATPLQRPLLEGLPFVDRVLTWEAGDLTEPRQALRPGAWRAAARAIREVRREGYDLVLACYGRLASAVALLSGAPHSLGYAGEAYPLALTAALPGKRYDRPGWHEVDYGVALVDFAAGKPAGEVATCRPDARGEAAPAPRLGVTEEGRAGLVPLLEERAGRAGPKGLEGFPPGRLIVLHPGVTNGRAKRWPVPYWVDLAGRLRRDGATVVLAGGPDVRPFARAVRGAAGDGILDLTGRTSLPVLMALLERADALVSGDSGPVHLAVSLERPVVAIHGPTDPRESGPFRGARAVVARRDLPCSPCYTLERIAECPLGHALCQWLVTPEEVYRAVHQLLGAAPPEPRIP